MNKLINDNGFSYSELVDCVISPTARRFFRTNDSVYCNYVLDETNVLRCLNIPEEMVESYPYAEIKLSDYISAFSSPNAPTVYDIDMSEWSTNASVSYMVVYTNVGVYLINCSNKISRLKYDDDSSIVEYFKGVTDTLLKKHLNRKHYETSILSRFNESRIGVGDRTIFDFIPTQANHDYTKVTRSYGVEEDAEGTHTAVDSVLVVKDALINGTVISDSASNPGVVFAAVDSPMIRYDSNSWERTQVANVIKNTAYYDFFYKTRVNAAGSDVLSDILNLNHLPFIYRVNSDATWDLYVNIPSTMTPYLNRIEGTNMNVKGGRATVYTGSIGKRKNVGGKAVPSSISESCTKVRLYIDRAHFDAGIVREVEISGSSLPMYVYRDTEANDGLYDGVSLQSVWDRTVSEVTDNMTGKLYAMIEFDVWGSDEQSVHLRGELKK